jgi:peptidoglycan/LPS O-acetylase OafA/YrhL
MPRPVDGQSSYVPGLDGIRAFAVLAVMGYHFGVPHMEGGLLGVGVFFTLSGFLITGILLSTWEKTGGFALRRFWLHRARRLLPALAVLLVAVLGVSAIVERDQLATRWHEAVAAAFYVSNWAVIANGQSYFDYFTGPQPLDHLWSLAIEEQFYLFWPLALLVLLRLCNANTAKVARITLALAATSFVLMSILAMPGFDNTRVYEGTDTRAGELLVGAALALVYRPSRVRTPEKWGARIGIDLAGLAALGVLVWLVTATTFYSMSLYRGGLLLLSLATALLVAVASHPASLLGRALGVEPLRWIGERSYGIYLWHMAVVAFTPQNLLDNYSLRLAIFHLALTLALAAISWTLVENPIRTHGFVGACKRLVPLPLAGDVRAPKVAVGGAALCFASIVSLSVASALNPTASQASQEMLDPGMPPLPPPEEPAEPGSHHHSMQTHGGGKGTTPDPGAGMPSEQPGRTGDTRSPSPWQTSCQSVVHVGDSTSVGLMDPNYLPTRSERIDAQYRDVGVQNVATDILGARSIVERYKDQPNAEEATQERIDDGYDGCWVFAMGTNDTANQYVGGVVSLDDRIALLMDAIHGQPAMWLTVKTRLSSGPWDEENMQKWNDALMRACNEYPNMRVYDWASQLRDGWFISDGIHFTTPGYAERGQRTARALAVAFPAEGSSPDSCLVTPN